MIETAEVLPVTAVKQRLTELVKKLEDPQHIIAITKNGFPAAALVSMQYLEGLLETIEILSDSKLMKSLRRAQAQMENGDLLDLDDVL